MRSSNRGYLIRLTFDPSSERSLAGTRDFDGTRRPKGAAMDIGADEYEP
ncbi:MAG: hypothetical protein KJ042_05455 [Deltaproteobacteria bacterium]|nr:hypothetical protein [Deltaproteobacteria bacterium]